MMADRIESIPTLIKDISGRQYVPGQRLGAGGFATCWRAAMIDHRRATETPECALKVVRAKIKTKTLSHRFKVELQVHSKLHHPNIVEFYRAFTFQENTYIVLELCHNGSLAEMVKKRRYLTMGEIRRFLIQLCGAVKYLHQRDVVHRDIKAGNIFLDENMNVKLGDFGLSAVMVSAGSYIRRTTFCGTPNYLAPEVLNRDGSGHGASVDIWAIGVMAYYMSVGRAPFHSKSKEEIYEKLRAGDYAWPELAPEQNEIPQDLKDLVSTLLVPELQRPTPDNIVGHPFFHGFIPSKLEPLSLSRRPRWARIGRVPDGPSKTYDALCRQSAVGHLTGNAIPRKKLRSIVKAIADEIETSPTQLQIPLPESDLYLGIAPPKRGLAVAIMEDRHIESMPSEGSNTGKINDNVAVRRPLADASGNRMREGSSSAGTFEPGIPIKVSTERPAHRVVEKLLCEQKVKRPRRAGVNYDLMNYGSLR